MTLKKNTVCLEANGQRKDFPIDQANNILAIQGRQGRDDWKLAAGQNYELKDGKIVERSDSEHSSENRTARGTKKLQ